MKTLTSSEARERWRDVLDQVQAGQVVEITRHGKVIARVIPPDAWRTATEQAAELDYMRESVLGPRLSGSSSAERLAIGTLGTPIGDKRLG